MSNASTTLSLVALEQLIAERTGQIEKLLAKRDALQQSIEVLDAEIQACMTPEGLVKRRRRRIKNEVPLRSAILQILGKNKKGLSLPDLATKVIESGYKTSSKNFRNVLYQCLYNTKGIAHDSESGRYRLGE